LLIHSMFLDAQIGRVGINTSTPQAMLHVKDSAVLFTGATTLPGTPGNPPITGQGLRMMWYPDKAAFRVGYDLANAWDKINIGNYSFASGYNTKAMNDFDVAIGTGTVASGGGSFASGNGSIATGQYSIALGFFSSAIGFTSTALGTSSEANGNYSLAAGFNSSAAGHMATSLGDN